MTTTTKTRKSSKSSDVVESQLSQEEARQQIEIAAYFKWLARTDGTPVAEEDSVQFYLEAEQEFIQTQGT